LPSEQLRALVHAAVECEHPDVIRACSATLAAATVALLATGCGGAPAAGVAKGPKAALPPIAAPRGYRVQHVWRANLSEGRSSLVVSSVGPHGTAFNGIHGRSMDLRVLSWAPRSRRWRVRFDAHKVPMPDDSCIPGSQDGPGCYVEDGSEYLGFAGVPATLLDPKANVYLGPVRFVHLLSRRHDQLVFSASNDYGGSGTPMVPTVVDFAEGEPFVAYTWSGQLLRQWHVARRRLDVQAADWTWDDPHCCPLRSYHFTLAPRQGAFVETRDDRPWLGVTAHQRGGWTREKLDVVGIAPRSPARNALRVGDVLLKVLNPPRLPHGHQPWQGLLDRLEAFRPGQVVQLLVERHGTKVVVRVKLGSVKNAIANVLPQDNSLLDL
jgi:hypothetical protein